MYFIKILYILPGNFIIYLYTKYLYDIQKTLEILICKILRYAQFKLFLMIIKFEMFCLEFCKTNCFAFSKKLA